jgi:hypothetical protein
LGDVAEKKNVGYYWRRSPDLYLSVTYFEKYVVVRLVTLGHRSETCARESAETHLYLLGDVAEKKTLHAWTI